MRQIILCSLLLLAAITAQADDNLLCPIPVFAECPDTLTADCGDTIRYQFQLLDQRNGQPRADARYFIARGYGQIDSLTGEYRIWRQHPEFRLVGAIRVVAYFTTSNRPDSAYCLFIAMICPGGPPRIAGDCPRQVGSFQRGTYVQSRFFAESVCNDLSWSVIAPDDSNVTATIDQRGLLFLTGTKVGDYAAYVILTDSCGVDTCGVNFSIIDDYPYDVRIEQLRNQIQSQYVFVDVTIDSVLPAHGLGGYDLLIKYDNSALTLSEVIEGDIFANCGWEYFTYRFGADGNCPECPSGLVRVIGIAETNNGNDHPTCDVPDSLPAQLFRMKFLISNDRTLVCQYTPIQFYWRDCEDNRLKCESGYCNYFMAGRVFDSLYAPFPIDSMAGIFPGTNGLPYDSCRYISNLSPAPQRYVDFYHGGIGIVCEDSIDARGDVNLNGLAYELADAVLYARYFVYGLPVFTINQWGQIAASDVNADGLPLTVEDFVILNRITLFGENPNNFPQVAIDTAWFNLDQEFLDLVTQDTLGAICIDFKGRVSPTLLAGNVKMEINANSISTRVLIYPDLENPRPNGYVLQGAILGGIDHHEILTIETASHRGGRVKALYDNMTDADEGDAPSLPTSFALHQNYPNPFNAGTVISFDLPRASEVNLEIINVLGNVVYRKKMTCSAGTQQINWNGITTGGSEVASGVYYYRLTAGSFTDTKKMLLLK